MRLMGLDALPIPAPPAPPRSDGRRPSVCRRTHRSSSGSSTRPSVTADVVARRSRRRWSQARSGGGGLAEGERAGPTADRLCPSIPPPFASSRRLWWRRLDVEQVDAAHSRRRPVMVTAHPSTGRRYCLQALPPGARCAAPRGTMLAAVRVFLPELVEETAARTSALPCSQLAQCHPAVLG